MKLLPVGVQNFITVRNKGYYFVDKSMLIGQILDQNTEEGVYLYTRPRRFGKSLNLSMLDAFFNIKYKGNTWFDGLEISKHPKYDCYKNAFPVIHIDFKNAVSYTMDGFLRRFNNLVLEAYKEHLYLLESNVMTDDERDLYTHLSKKNISQEDLMDSLNILSMLLERYHGAKTIVLIDEYDGVVNKIKDKNLRRDIIAFIGEVLSSLLKGNKSLLFGVVTGVMQIVKENIFSGVNNFSKNNIFDIDFDEMFGFTDDEVKQICADYGHPEKFEEAKEWYDGYRFGNAEIYNPWSILSYVRNDFKPDTYWVNTSGNQIIPELLANADEELRDNLKILGSGGSIGHAVTAELTFDDLGDQDSIYSLMVISGYLKAIPGDEEYILSIPNRELFRVFSQVVSRNVFGNDNNAKNLRRFSNALISNNTEAMKRSLEDLFMENISSRILKDENSYQTFIVAMLMCLFGNYEIKADFENGRGFSDILMRKKKGIGPNVVIELKKSSDDNRLEHDAQAAIQQIKDREYAHGLEGRTILYGIAFSGKKPFVISEEIQ